MLENIGCNVIEFPHPKRLSTLLNHNIVLAPLADKVIESPTHKLSSWVLTIKGGIGLTIIIMLSLAVLPLPSVTSHPIK